MDTLTINALGIIITYDPNNRKTASISSTLRDPEDDCNECLNAALDVIESLVLAHFCAGIDVSSHSYLEGLQTALDAIENNY